MGPVAVLVDPALFFETTGGAGTAGVAGVAGGGEHTYGASCSSVGGADGESCVLWRLGSGSSPPVSKDSCCSASLLFLLRDPEEGSS